MLEKMKFIDLDSSHKKIERKIKINFSKIFKHKKFILGPEVVDLEKNLSNYTKSKAVCVSSGTDALLLAMMALNIGRGDEVITTPFTWGSNSEMIKFLGAKPVYVDINEKNFNINPDLIKKRITKKTKAIMTVNLFGQCCDYSEIRKNINGKKIYIIEDAAQSFGAKYKDKFSCNLGDISCTSFFPSKPLGSYGDGGACFTNNKKLLKKIKMIRNHGQIKKNHHNIMGHNARMDSIQAAIINLKLNIFEEEKNLRQIVAKRYDNLLKNKRNIIQIPSIEKFNLSVYAQYTLRVKNRKNIIEKFKKNKIPYNIFYPIPLYKQKAFLDKSYKLKNVEKIVSEVISIPFHPYLKYKEQKIISELFN